MRTLSPSPLPAFLGAAALLAPAAPAADWPHWRGPGYDGIALESVPDELPDELPVLWRAEAGTGFSSFAAVGRRVLTMGNEDDIDTVWCFDAGSGEVLWRHSYPCELDPLYYEGGPSATPTVHEGSVYTLSKKGHAFRLDLESGEVHWSRDLLADYGFELPEWSFAGSPFIDGDRVLLHVGRGGLALSRETGETVWKSSTETAGYATPVPFPAGGENAHLLFSAQALIAFDSAAGGELWQLPWRSSRDVNAADPLVSGERILVSSTSGAALLRARPGAAEPEKLWEQRDLRWYFNPGVLIDGHVYSIHGTTHRPTDLVCVDFETGEIVWLEESYGSGGLIAAGGTVILFDEGELTLFDATPEGFRPRLQQKILEGKCWTAPVLAHGRIYCRSAEGEVVCVGLAPR